MLQGFSNRRYNIKAVPSRIMKGRAKKGEEKEVRKQAGEDPNQESYTVFVKTWTCKLLGLQVNGSYTINGIKDMIYRVEGTPQDRQILMFHDQVLEDRYSLEHYEIGNWSLLHQRFRRYVLKILD